MHKNTIDAGEIGVEIFKEFCKEKGWNCHQASDFEDQERGIDYWVMLPDGIKIGVDIKNRAHNIFARLNLDTGRFSVRRPFSVATLASHIFLADTKELIALPDYLDSFVLEPSYVSGFRRTIYSMRKIDWKGKFDKRDNDLFVSTVMSFKNDLKLVLCPPWEFRFDDIFVAEDGRILCRYEGSDGKKYVNKETRELTFFFASTNRYEPLTEKSINSANQILDNLKKNKK